MINFDQTGLKLAPAAEWTLDEKGINYVPITGKEDKKQITAVFAGTADGHFLPLQLIYKGKTSDSHPKGVHFPADWDITHTESHWSTTTSNISYINNIINKYIHTTKITNNIPVLTPALLIMDVFKAQIDKQFIQHCKDNGILLAYIPSRCTDMLQPMDVSVNKIFKHHYKKEFADWHAGQILQKLSLGTPPENVMIDVKMSTVKPLAAQWIIKAWSEISPEIVKLGFEKSGIASVFVDQVLINVPNTSYTQLLLE